MSLNLLKKKIQENRLYYLLFSILISYQLVFEIIFYYDKVLINLDTYLEFLQLENYYYYGKQIIKVWPGSVVNLDKYNFNSTDLPLFTCRNMAGIPFGFAISKDEKMLSLEHTHPPASFVVHGQRFMVQKEIKRKWFSVLKNS